MVRGPLTARTMAISTHAPMNDDDDAPPEPGVALDEEPDQEPAHHRADQADDDVANHPVTAALHDHAGEPAGDQADHQPRDDAAGVEGDRCEVSAIVQSPVGRIVLRLVAPRQSGTASNVSEVSIQEISCRSRGQSYNSATHNSTRAVPCATGGRSTGAGEGDRLGRRGLDLRGDVAADGPVDGVAEQALEGGLGEVVGVAERGVEDPAAGRRSGWSRRSARRGGRGSCRSGAAWPTRRAG